MAVAVASAATSMEARSPPPSGSGSPSPGAPYPYPVQQQQQPQQQQQQPHPPQPYPPQMGAGPAGSPPPGWQPGPQHAAAFYAWQGGYAQMPHQHQQQFYDPNAAQFAQWYHHMMIQQQQQQQRQQPGRQGNAAAQGPDYFPAHFHPHNPFPSGTPPPAPQPGPGAYARPQPPLPTGSGAPGPADGNYNGFHPYRRPTRQNTGPTPPITAADPPQFATLAPAPPYARGADAAGSSSSLSSAHSRQRTASLKGQQQAPQQRPSPPPSLPQQQQQQQQRSRSQPAPSSLSRATAASPPAEQPRRGSPLTDAAPLTPPVRPPQPHSRTGSASSSASAAGTARPVAAQPKPKAASTISSGSIGSAPLAPPGVGVSTAPAGTPVARTPRPSPLGSAPPLAAQADKRKSRDDSELLGASAPLAADGAHRPSGLKGKLRRALSLSAAQSVEAPVASGDDEADGKKRSRRALFNAKLNASTDNISLSSTMSSASVVIRKLGSLGKMARRNSIAGITSVFKGRKGKDGGEDEDGVIVDEPPPEDAEEPKKEKRGRKFRTAKGAAVAPSVSHASVEVDRGSGPDFAGLSPAAELARRHTLKANAQEAALEAERLKESDPAQDDLPDTWAKNTATRAGFAGPPGAAASSGAYRTNEAGERVLVESDDSDTEHDHSGMLEVEDGEADWSRMEDAYERDEDDTIRGGPAGWGASEEEDGEEWAVGLRRSVERTLVPQRGILKNARNYDQHVFLERADPNAPAGLRGRANSYQADHEAAPGALAHMPSNANDPDHIDGVAKAPPSLPPLTFVDSPGGSDSEDAPKSGTSLFSQPALNSSAPVLSLAHPGPPALQHRAATAPSRKLTFASNLSVYDTFSGGVYDRRSEPATWSRLTPALAQRIKEELNSFKMEEMEVHAASRIHTQFFV